MAEYTITLPVVKFAGFLPGTVEAGGQTVLSATIGEETRVLHPEARCAGEFYTGE